MLLTSREKIADFNTYFLEELNDDDALKLFTRYYKRKDEEAIILKACNIVGNHTLTVELLAKTLSKLPNKNATYLCEQLEQNSLNIDCLLYTSDAADE